MNFLKCLTTPLKGIPLEKVATDKKYIPTKKNWEIYEWKLKFMGKSQILDLVAILTLNDLYYIMGYSGSCD